MCVSTESSVLFKSTNGAVVVIDIPRSIEEAQVLPGQTNTRRIISTDPVEKPWQVPESKKGTTSNNSNISPSAAISELMTLETVKAALETAKVSYDGPWCLPRVTRARVVGQSAADTPVGVAADAETDADPDANAAARLRKRRRRSSPAPAKDDEDPSSPVVDPFIPDQAYPVLGTIESQREAFLRKAPQFDLIVLDPPWPSRSVKRKTDRYSTVYNTEEARNLLYQIPVASQLKRNGLVAVWITNKPAIQDLLTGPDGVFAHWGLEPIGEWIWVKVTSKGEPVLDVNSTWRKPWERLLVARERGSSISLPTSTKVILGVPDIHSRKPNLRGLFADILPDEYQGLEVFARNLTAGWWSWGKEALFFQQRHHWMEEAENKGEETDGPPFNYLAHV